MVFKKGDKVRRCSRYLTTGGWHLGAGTVTVARSINGSLVLEEDSPGNGWEPSFFELVSSAPPTLPATGRKDDSGKLDMTLLDDMPRAMAALVEVMQWAITDKKPVPYDRGSWLGVHADRYRAAILRHNRDAGQQASVSYKPARFERDKETNLLHLAHIACSSMMALENALRELEQDQNANG